MKGSVRFSQNFLHSPQLVTNLLSQTNINAEDTVYDIGGGKGIIADALAQKCRTVISVEIDERLVDKLRENLRGRHNVLVYEADFLSMPLPQTPYKVFANIPFNLSADILRKLTATRFPPSTSYIIAQREFADKLTVKPGGYHSQQSILLGVRFEVRVIQRLQAVDFYPRPKVGSVLLEIASRPEPLLANEDMALFRDFIAYSYNTCQPTVAVGLSRLLTLTEFDRMAKTLRFPANATPAQLDLRQWLGLFASASQKRPLLEKEVGGHERAIEQRHSKRSKLHRTHADPK